VEETTVVVVPPAVAPTRSIRRVPKKRPPTPQRSIEPREVDDLISRLNGAPQASMRQEAAERLERVGAAVVGSQAVGFRVVEGLTLALVRDAEWRVRCGAARALRRLGADARRAGGSGRVVERLGRALRRDFYPSVSTLTHIIPTFISISECKGVYPSVK
jgi:hypothetical protein